MTIILTLTSPRSALPRSRMKVGIGGLWCLAIILCSGHWDVDAAGGNVDRSLLRTPHPMWPRPRLRGGGVGESGLLPTAMGDQGILAAPAISSTYYHWMGKMMRLDRAGGEPLKMVELGRGGEEYDMWAPKMGQSFLDRLLQQCQKVGAPGDYQEGEEEDSEEVAEKMGKLKVGEARAGGEESQGEGEGGSEEDPEAVDAAFEDYMETMLTPRAKVPLRWPLGCGVRTAMLTRMLMRMLTRMLTCACCRASPNCRSC